MKRYIFFIFLLLIPLLAWAISVIIDSPGNWNDGTIWTLGVPANDISQDVVINNNVGTITVQNGDSYFIGSLDMKNDNQLIIESGAILVLGSSSNIKHLNAQNASTLEVSGTLIIWGDLNLSNDLSVNITGNMIVHGDYNGGNDAILTINGTLDIDGDANAGGNSELHGTGTINLSGTCNGPDSFCLSGPLDTEPPVISDCPNDITVSLSGADCDEVVGWTEPTASDNNSVQSFTRTHAPGTTFPLGITVVTYTATDSGGNVAICTFNVTVNDNTAPVISSCPADIVVSLSGVDCDEVVNWAVPTAVDNCSLLSFNSTHNPGETFPAGTTVVSYIATDPAGNVATCTFNVTVNDNIVPVISSCPADIMVSLSGATCDEVVNWVVPTATDNCTVDSFTSTHNPGDAFPGGLTVVTYTATDLDGNVATCTFNVTVNDNIAPVITGCPADILISTSSTNCDEAVNWAMPTATDNCNVASFTSTHNSGDTFPSGITMVTYTATDLDGNVATCTFNVTVNDNIAPVISGCPTDILVSTRATTCDEVVNWVVPTAMDNCTLDTFSSTHNSGDTFPAGTTVVSYTATDLAGNVATCNFNVIVNDNIGPVISGCPADIVVNLDGATCDQVVNWVLPTATDNCAVASFNSTHNPGDTFPVGTTVVSYIATDAAGNVAPTCTFNVIVNETTLPQFDFCPTSVNISVFDVDEQSAVVTWQEPVASDNCGISTIIGNFNSGDKFPPGLTRVIYTATDASGNTANCEFDVDVIGNKAPTGSPVAIEAFTGEPIEICLDVRDEDGDELIIDNIDYSSLNGAIEQSNSVDKLCFVYTSFDDFEGEEVLVATVCDNGTPTACVKVEVRIKVAFDLRLNTYKAFTPDGDNINDVWVIIPTVR